jgi:hypothetical protein
MGVGDDRCGQELPVLHGIPQADRLPHRSLAQPPLRTSYGARVRGFLLRDPVVVPPAGPGQSPRRPSPGLRRGRQRLANSLRSSRLHKVELAGGGPASSIHATCGRAEARRRTDAPPTPRPVGHRRSDRRSAKPAPSGAARLPVPHPRSCAPADAGGRTGRSCGARGVGQADRRQCAPQREHNSARVGARACDIVPAPERFDQLIASDRPATVEDEECEVNPPLGPGERLGELLGSDLNPIRPSTATSTPRIITADVTPRDANVAGPVLVVHLCTRDA